MKNIGNPQPTTHNPQPTTHNPQPTTHNPQPTAHSPQPTAHNPQPTTTVTTVTTAATFQIVSGWNFKGKFLVGPDGTVSDAASEGDSLATAIEELM